MGHGHKLFTPYVAGNLIKATGPYLLKALIIFEIGLTESHHGITQ